MKTPLWFILSLSLLACPAYAAQPVGEVTFLIGQARRVDAGGQIHTLDAGSKVLVGDRIETGASGHVHVRFIDHAFVSVRPGSRLTVERYSYYPANPSASAVRFTLGQGVVRTITGEAGKLRPDRYRLNTPLAAIGVRGTDFVTRAGADATQVLLNRGSVEVSTLGPNCAAQGFDRCSADRTALLSEHQKGFIIQLGLRQTVPRLIALDPKQILELFGIGLEEPAAATNARKSSSTRGESGRTSNGRTDWIHSDASRDYLSGDAGAQAGRAAVRLASTPVAQSPPEPTGLEPTGLEPTAAPTPPSAPPANLVWGRWGEPATLKETVSVPYEEASADRKVTVGNRDYGLFRTEGEERTLSPSLQGKADFSLTSGTAELVRGGTVDPASIDGGRLQVDFSAARYSTDLQVSHPTAGAHTVHSAGRMSDEGMFADKTATQWVAGAVAQDGATAGYFFEKQVPDGTFKGLTLWGR